MQGLAFLLLAGSWLTYQGPSGLAIPPPGAGGEPSTLITNLLYASCVFVMMCAWGYLALERWHGRPLSVLTTLVFAALMAGLGAIFGGFYSHHYGQLLHTAPVAGPREPATSGVPTAEAREGSTTLMSSMVMTCMAGPRSSGSAKPRDRRVVTNLSKLGGGAQAAEQELAEAVPHPGQHLHPAGLRRQFHRASQGIEDGHAWHVADQVRLGTDRRGERPSMVTVSRASCRRFPRRRPFRKRASQVYGLDDYVKARTLTAAPQKVFLDDVRGPPEHPHRPGGGRHRARRLGRTL
jgi:hypothetical protein